MKKFLLLIITLHISFIAFSKGLHSLLPPDTISYPGSPVVCNGGSLLLKADPAPAGATYEWKLNGTNILGAVSFSYIAMQSGTYTVVVNSVTYRALKVIIDPRLDVAFTLSTNTTCSGADVKMTSVITGGTAPYTYSWKFGDGGISTAANPTHAFTSSGCGTVAMQVDLVVTDANGCSKAATSQITVKQAPDVQLEDIDVFTPFSNCDKSPTSSDPDFTITVKNISPDAACITSYSINWGDGNTQNNIPASSFPLMHTYKIVGAFNLVISGQGTNGCTGTKKYVVANQSNPAGSLGTLGSTTNLCVPASVPFTISNWQLNSPGTSYILDFGDGNDTTLNSPLNNNSTDQVINHAYITTSCPQSSYTAVLQVINACDVTPFTAGNIQIRMKPRASFTIPQPACAGKDICFVNTTAYGSYGPTCSSATSYSWDFGDGTPVDTRENPCHSFAGTGNYNVTLTTSNPCGASLITLPVCITAPPTSAFTIDNTTGCAPLAVSAINTSINSTNKCQPLTYLWTVSYAQDFCGTSSLWDFTNGKTDTSANPSFSFKNPGTYTITLAITNACGTFTTNKTITVKQPPAVEIDSVLDKCEATTITPAASVSSCGAGTLNYAWTFSGGNPASSQNADPGPVSFISVGQHTISLSVTNDCGTTKDNTVFSISGVIDANAGPDQTKCTSDITMAANTPASGTGTWRQLSGPNTAFITDPASPITTVTGLAKGEYKFEWKISSGDCFDTSDVTITILTNEPAATGPPQGLCLATSATLSGNVPSAGSGVWSFINGPAGSLITDPASPTTMVTRLTPGTYIFRWTINYSTCTPTMSDVEVKIYDAPTKANAGQDQTVCIPEVTVKGNNPITGTGLWTIISGPNVPDIADPLSPSTIITNLLTGTYLFKWTVSNPPCLPSEDTVQVTVTAISNNSLIGDQQICINTIPQIITGSTPTGGSSTYNYQWEQSTDSGIVWTTINGANTSDYQPAALIQSTCYRRQVTTTFCSGVTGSYTPPICITVNPDARAIFNVTDTVLCPGVNLDSIITVTAFPDRNLQYSWYANGVLIISNTTGQPPSYPISSPGQTIVVKLIATSKYGCKPDSMTIQLRTLPAVIAGFSKDVAEGCGPLTVTFTNTSNILNNSVQFFWDFGDGRPVENILQPAPVTYESSVFFRDTVYHITLKAFSGCDTTIWRDSVKIFANSQARFSSSPTGCSPFRDTIINNSAGNNLAYYWDFGDGKEDTTYTTGKFVHNYNTGIVDTFLIRLIAENKCGRDTQVSNLVVSPNIIQSQISINGNQLYGCAPHTVGFINSSAGASLLYFNYGDGTPEEAIPDNTPTVQHTFTSAGIDTVRIRLINDCTDTTVVKYITVYAPPVSSFRLENPVICSGNIIVTNNTSQNANSYEWLWGDNTTTSSFDATHRYNTAGIYTVRLIARKLNNFGIVCTDTSESIAVNVVDRIPAVININPGSKCAPYNITVSAANADAAARVDWYFYDSNSPNGVTQVTGAVASYVYNFTGTDSVKLVVQNLAGCKDSATERFTVNKTPSLIFIPFNSKTCNTDTIITFNVSLNYDGNDPIKYSWFINEQLAGSSNPFTYNFNVPSGSTSIYPYNIKVLAQNSFGCGDTTSFGNFTIQTLAPQRIQVLPSLVQEQPNYTFTFQDTSLALNNTTYLWDLGDKSIQLPGKEIKYTYGDTGEYKVSLLVTDYETGCIETDSTHVTILAVPGYLYLPSAFCPGCQKAELRQFLPLGKGLKDYRLSIFNIYGQKIFETTSLDANGVPNEPWDGNWKNGKNAQQDAYSWHIVAHYINGTEWKGMNNQKSGYITIIR